jgi:ABC-type glycerol-3-phosphate transport system permease component
MMLIQFFLRCRRPWPKRPNIDGAGQFRIYRSMYLPLNTPALATVAIARLRVRVSPRRKKRKTKYESFKS